jgi:thymidylate synthase (FAD)
MFIIEPSYEILTQIDGVAMLKRIEKYARVCYKSEDLITDDSYIKFLTNIVLTNHHESIIEHEYITVKFTVDRGVSHELVRHRIANYTQSSTRYCNYSKGKFGNAITAVNMSSHFTGENAEALQTLWEHAMIHAEKTYMEMINLGVSPQIARSVLPNSLMTEIIMTANLREWRHILELRTAKGAHPQMREIMILLLREFREKIPLLFDHIEI